MPTYEFTDDARLVLAMAQDEGVRLQHAQLEPEHIILGLCRDDAVRSIFHSLRVAPEAVRNAIEALVPPGDAPPPERKLRLSTQVKKVLEHALAAARDQRDSHVRPEHFLVALLRPDKGAAAEILTQCGITIERVRSFLPTPEAPAPERFRVSIDDSSDRSIYEQIVAQITEAVATGELHPGDRLPTVRQLADQLDVAPGTVARAYSELEGQGVVITEGVRGTRVAEPTDTAGTELVRSETLAGLLRPVAVAAFHLGANAADLRTALDEAMRGIFDKQDHAA